ncbi:universal stress protein [Pseudonocardia broussonetiae]|uniref:Universal stress protein n=1 Tax=Pseudonocardia broussonetiae TaxID=2736640 RepID=A0A6M6JP11_9PSEU|nr:universal stress protein [Pseudonocardia broussonetiae]QJY48973.1 universal stress protein [Pseudonocardia broussonetiae]
MDAQGRDRAGAAAVTGPVVVGVDDAPHALRAVRWAAAEAARLDVPLRLVGATGPPGEHLPGRAGRHRALEAMLARARVAAEAMMNDTGAGAVQTQVRRGVPSTVLVDESRAARLLVVGDRGTSRLEGVLAGSVAVALLRRAACPVVVVRGPERDPAHEAGRPVVVGFDATPAAATALDVALDAAAARGVELVVVHTTPEPVGGPDADLLVAPAVARAVLDEVEQRVATEQVTARTAGHDVAVRMVAGRGRAAEVLLAEAARAQLVVVGSRGRGELAGLVLGSVSTLLVHHAGCPVTVVGPLAAARAGRQPAARRVQVAAPGTGT